MYLQVTALLPMYKATHPLGVEWPPSRQMSFSWDLDRSTSWVVIKQACSLGMGRMFLSLETGRREGAEAGFSLLLPAPPTFWSILLLTYAHVCVFALSHFKSASSFCVPLMCLYLECPSMLKAKTWNKNWVSLSPLEKTQGTRWRLLTDP